MHSFQPSRGRILLEVFCALAVVASMVGAWRQTHATALLVAAGAAGLLAMIRLFDLVRDQPTLAEEPQRIAFEPEAQVAETEAENLPADVPLKEVEALPVPDVAAEEPEVAEPARRTGAGRRKGGSRKGNGRRANAAKAAEVIEFPPVEEAAAAPPPEPIMPVQVDEPGAAEPEPFEVAEVPEAESPVEHGHVPHAPLFEPDPYVRMPRQAFGRRGRL